MKRLSFFLIFISIIIGGCTRPPHRPIDGQATISVTGEYLYLSPLVNNAQLESLPGWPSDPERQKILLRQLSDMSTLLYSEFTRCEKYGLYKMVDDAGGPTVRIAITLLPFNFSNDSLRMPVRLEAEHLADGQRYIYTLSATGVVPKSASGDNPFHKIGLLLGDFRRNFPYHSLVSFFYPHEEE